jgi:ribosomal protein S18 acetylase RimI-like enzyme
MTTFLIAKTNLDFEQIANLGTIIWREHYTPIIGSDQVTYMLDKFQSVSAVKKQIQEGTEYYIIKHQNTMVGYLSFYKKEDALFLSKLYVLGTERGKGIGKAAMSFLENKRVEIACKSIDLTVNKYNTNSIKAYEKMGFEKIDSVIMDIGNGYVMDDYVMKKEVG